MRRCLPLFVCLTLAFTGCRTGRYHTGLRAPDWESPESIAATQARQSQPANPGTNSARPAGPAAVGPVAMVHTNQMPSGWIRLDEWCALNHQAGLAEPQMASAATVVRSAQGSLLLQPGSASAFWNGSEVKLGFAPRVQNGGVMLQALDLQKTVQPLLLGERVTPKSVAPMVVIDAGHGGSDPGAQAAAGSYAEKELTLDWARRVALILVSKGWRVVCTRSNDTDMPLAARVAIAETHDADVFLSLHFNSSTERRQQGIETYCLTPMGMKSTMNRGYDDDPSVEYPNNAFDALNITLAHAVHAKLVHATGSHDRGVRRARFPAVLKSQNRPAILVEGGYISSPEEAEKIATPEYRQKLAEAVGDALGSYVNLPVAMKSAEIETARTIERPASTNTSAVVQ